MNCNSITPVDNNRWIVRAIWVRMVNRDVREEIEDPDESKRAASKDRGNSKYLSRHVCKLAGGIPEVSLFRMQNASKYLKAVDDTRTGTGEVGVGIDNVDAVIARGGKFVEVREGAE